MTDISIVVPSFNEEQYIGEALASLLEQQFSGTFEIVVADNGSTDNTRTIVKQLEDVHPEIRLIDASERRGAAFARNKGVEQSCGRGVLFVDADDQVAPGWLSAMAAALSEFDLVACGFDTQTLNEPWQSESWENGQDGQLNNFDPPFLPWSGAGALGVLREKHLEVGGFDQSLLVLEDADYCWRVQMTGTKMHFVSSTNILYRFPKKYSQMYGQMKRLGQYHALLYKRYVNNGMPRLEYPVAQAYRRWKRWFRKIRRARTRAQRASLIRDLGWNVGRLYGSVRYRIMDF